MMEQRIINLREEGGSHGLKNDKKQQTFSFGARNMIFMKSLSVIEF